MFSLPRLPWVFPNLSLPAIPLPVDIQRRFVSFLLQQSLGHLVKPGQLDAHHIDAQIGNGSVDIAQVELDEQAINGLISALPLRLRSGSISKISASIPWASIFSAPLKLSMTSLDLTFVLSPPTSSAAPNLAESVASIAESFMRDQLHDHESELLHQSVLQEIDKDGRQLPGYMDPFLTENLTDPEDVIESSTEGVGVLASLVERLLAHFAFVVQGITIKIVHEGNSEFTLRIPEISYGKEDHLAQPSGDDTVVTTMRIGGVSLSIKNLKASLPQQFSQPTHMSSVSPPSSDDEESNKIMSQSIVSLPMQSPASSLYFSATSSVHTFLHEGSSFPPFAEEVVLSLGSDPITARLLTRREHGDTGGSGASKGTTASIVIDVGAIAGGLNPQHVHAIVHALGYISLPPSPPAPSSAAPRVLGFDVKINCRGVILLLFQDVCDEDQLASFYLHPLSSSPKTSHFRVQLDTLGLRLSESVNGHLSTPIKQTIEFSLSELNIIAFHFAANAWVASPILFTDPQLPFQYDEESFPAIFELASYKLLPASGGLPKISHWRSRISKRKSLPPSTVPSPSQAIVGTFETGDPYKPGQARLSVLPLNICLDMDVIGRLLPFVDSIMLSGELKKPVDLTDDGEETESEATPPITPRARVVDLTDSTQHRDPKSSNIAVRCPFIRIGLKCPSPPSSSDARSGTVALDIHEIELTTGESSPERKTRFGDDPPPRSTNTKVLGIIQWKKLSLAYVGVQEVQATSFLALSPLRLGQDGPRSFSEEDGEILLLPRMCIRRNSRLPEPMPNNASSPSSASSVSIECQLPALQLEISKILLDGLQLWADDLTQWMERTFGEPVNSPEGSRDPSLIGSRYFMQRTSSVVESDNGGEPRKSETVIKLSVSEASIRLLIPRHRMNGSIDVRPLIMIASDVDLLTEIKPEGKNETVATLGVTNIQISDTLADNSEVILLDQTRPRSLNGPSKPLLKLRFATTTDPSTSAKESRVKLSLFGFTYTVIPDFSLGNDLALFGKAPPGAFESVIPTERTRVAVKILDGSIRVLAPKHTGALVVYIGDLDFVTQLISDSPEILFQLSIPALSLLLIDDTSTIVDGERGVQSLGAEFWKKAGYALLTEVEELELRFRHNAGTIPSDSQVVIKRSILRLHLCADSISALAAFGNDLGSLFKKPDKPIQKSSGVTSIQRSPRTKGGVLGSIDEDAFKGIPDVGPAPDFIRDDLPTNPDYLDASFGAAGGLTEMTDEHLLSFDDHELFGGRQTPTPSGKGANIISSVGGETIRILDTNGIHVVEDYFVNLPADSSDDSSNIGSTSFTLRARDCDIFVRLYDGYDWVQTRKAIEEEVKAVRRRLEKIRQLLATGQASDESVEDTCSLLFNSVCIGLPPEADELEPGALIAAIDDELNYDELETASQSSWQSFSQKKPPKSKPPKPSRTTRLSKLTRSKGSRIDFCLSGLQAEMDVLRPDEPLASSILVIARDFEILDHIKTSTWKKFLTEMRSDSRGNIRETDSNMVRVELRNVRPVPGLPTEEARLRAKLLPLRLHVDQDALDFLKKFFSFQDSNAAISEPSSPSSETFFQHVEIFPVEIKLDYKPKRVDYKALRDGRTIELMNFFHFDGSEMTLRHITLSGITGWARVGELLNDLWTPDVKANQLADVISGVSPIRSVVNVGSGVADLILLPIAQYQKDRRVVRGVQRGTNAFVKSTAMEAMKLGARLAAGTQVILEQAESVLGGQGQFKDTIMTETVQATGTGADAEWGGLSDDEGGGSESDSSGGGIQGDLFSKYASQPADVREGIESAYKSLRKNLNSAAQTILAVPMEVYERSGNEGPVRKVIRAVPIAVLRPMIGATEAVSKTLLGLRNTLDPDIRMENEAKYKKR